MLKRKILFIDEKVIKIGTELRRFKYIVWCLPTSETSRTYKTTSIRFYVTDGKNSGLAGVTYVKSVSINKSNPLKSKVFADIDLDRQFDKASQEAFWNYIGSLNKTFTGTIQMYGDGQGFVRCPELNNVRIIAYACNFKDANSQHEKLVTNVHVADGALVSFTLKDYGTTVHCGACDIQVMS